MHARGENNNDAKSPAMRTGSVATFGSIGSRRNLPPFTFSNGRVSDPSSTVGGGLHFRPRENRAANGDATIFVLSISFSLSLLLLLYFPRSRDSRPNNYVSYCEMQIARMETRLTDIVGVCVEGRSFGRGVSRRVLSEFIRAVLKQKLDLRLRYCVIYIRV